MRVRAYVDGFNLYYGARRCCGRGTAGWRWLNLRALIENVVSTQGAWTQVDLQKVTYCTARVDAVTNPEAHRDQDVYLKAIAKSGSVDWIEYGNYVARTKSALLARRGKQGRPEIHHSNWPVMIQTDRGDDVPSARFMVSYLHLEEKGSDVNLASHMLLDVLQNEVDGVIVLSNDSDLAFPIRAVRERVPVAVINPYNGYIAGDLTGAKEDGAGRHWWWKLNEKTYRSHQLPDPIDGFTKPQGW
jgi:uncharacterized LabA/DUF88 family protein